MGAAPSSNCRNSHHELCRAHDDQAVRCTCSCHGEPDPDTSVPAAWTHADAWVMAAVAGAAEPSLSDVIAYGDACNHAIFTHEELAVGVGRLVASGLMEPATSDRLTLTPAGGELASRLRGGLFGQVDSMLRLLNRVDLVEGRWDLNAASITAAVREYRGTCPNRRTDD